MDTHDEKNNTDPKGQFSSVFKGVPIISGDANSNGQHPGSVPSQDGADSFFTKPSNPQMQDRRTSNPYRQVQSPIGDNPNGQFRGDPFAQIESHGLWQQIKDRLFPDETGEGSARQKVMVVLVPVLAIVLIFVLRQVLSKAPQQTQAAPEDDAQIAAITADAGNEIDWRIPEPIPVVLRDPIKPAEHPVMPNVGHADSNDVEAPSVRGILYSDDKPSAVIGNQIVHLNDVINGAKVVLIDPDFVVFEKDGKRWTKKVADLELQMEREFKGQEVHSDILSLEEEQ